jgi:hypothetical protein
MIAVGPSGEVYAAGIDGNDDARYRSFRGREIPERQEPRFDSGLHGDGDQSLRWHGVRWAEPAGLLGQANVAVDSSSESTRGNAYVVASVAGADPLDAMFSRSADGGITWSAAVRVNDDDSQDNWQWFAAHSVSPNGRIDMIWNDSRASGQPNLSQLYYAYSWDGGATWSTNVAVSPAFDSLVGFPNQDKIGDYYGIVSSATGPTSRTRPPSIMKKTFGTFASSPTAMGTASPTSPMSLPPRASTATEITFPTNARPSWSAGRLSPSPEALPPTRAQTAAAEARTVPSSPARTSCSP